MALDDKKKDEWRCIDLAISPTSLFEDIGKAALSDPAAFWKQLHPHQILALLEAAPSVLGPWVFDAEGLQARRRRYAVDPEDTTAAYASGGGGVYGCWRTYVAARPSRGEGGHSTTLADNMNAADAALRAAGWMLVGGERKT
jgi:hypothetical protein